MCQFSQGLNGVGELTKNPLQVWISKFALSLSLSLMGELTNKIFWVLNNDLFNNQVYISTHKSYATNGISLGKLQKSILFLKQKIIRVYGFYD